MSRLLLEYQPRLLLRTLRADQLVMRHLMTPQRATPAKMAASGSASGGGGGGQGAGGSKGCAAETEAEKTRRIAEICRQQQLKRQQEEEKARVPKRGYFKSGGTHAVFNDCPVPEGDFYQAYYAKNSRYNLILFSGIVSLIGSIAYVMQSGEMDLYSSIPEYPYTKEELEEFELIEEEKIIEQKRQEEQRLDRAYELEQSIKHRLAHEALDKELALMQQDLDTGGLEEEELAQLKQLIAEREEFEKADAVEVKRRNAELAEREKQNKKEEKERQDRQKQRQKEREAKQKEIEKQKKAEEKRKKKQKN